MPHSGPINVFRLTGENRLCRAVRAFKAPCLKYKNILCAVAGTVGSLSVNANPIVGAGQKQTPPIIRYVHADAFQGKGQAAERQHLQKIFLLSAAASKTTMPHCAGGRKVPTYPAFPLYKQ